MHCREWPAGKTELEIKLLIQENSRPQHLTVYTHAHTHERTHGHVASPRASLQNRQSRVLNYIPKTSHEHSNFQSPTVTLTWYFLVCVCFTESSESLVRHNLLQTALAIQTSISDMTRISRLRVTDIQVSPPTHFSYACTSVYYLRSNDTFPFHCMYSDAIRH